MTNYDELLRSLRPCLREHLGFGVVGMFGPGLPDCPLASGWPYQLKSLGHFEGVPDGTMAVRRIDLVHLDGKVAYGVALPGAYHGDLSHRELRRFVAAMSKPVASETPLPEVTWMSPVEVVADEPPCVPMPNRGLLGFMRSTRIPSFCSRMGEDDEDLDAMCGDFGDDELCASAPVEKPELEQDIDLELAKKEWIDRVSALVLDYVARFHELPDVSVIEDVVRGKLSFRNPKGLSPVHVNGDLHIVLPAYNEMELRMTPLARTVYIFFLCHPEGVMLSEVYRYAAELEQIYMLVKPTADERRVAASIADLVSPTGESLQQKLSMTRRAVRRQIMHPHIAEHYLIKGDRGGRFGIDLPAQMRKLPAILRWRVPGA